MAQIIDFEELSVEHEDDGDGFTYFSKGVLDALCEDVEDAEWLLLQVYDGKRHRYIQSADYDPEKKTVVLVLE